VRAFSSIPFATIGLVSIACASTANVNPQPPMAVASSQPPPVASAPPPPAPKPIVDVGELQAHAAYSSNATALDGTTIGMDQVPIAELPPGGAAAWARFAAISAKYHGALADEQRLRDWLSSRVPCFKPPCPEPGSPQAMQEILAKRRARLALQGHYITSRDALRRTLLPPEGKHIEPASAAVLGWVFLEMSTLPPVGSPPSPGAPSSVVPDLPEAVLDTPAERRLRDGFRAHALELFESAKTERLATESVGWFARYELASHHETKAAIDEWRALVAASEAKHLGAYGARTLLMIAETIEKGAGWAPERVKALRDATHLATDAQDKLRLAQRWMTGAAEIRDWPGCVDASREMIEASGAQDAAVTDEALRAAAICLDHGGVANERSFAEFGERASVVAASVEKLMRDRATKPLADRARDLADECMYLRGKKERKITLIVYVQDGAPPRAEIWSEGDGPAPAWVGACVATRSPAYFSGSESSVRAIVSATVGD
jgi:hypothetical protein